ncbi:MAG: CDP-alcohol phosphatidyltransferase family protein [Proteobacteria bacterium]|nr:CDP-alcohol phosphatidyltransferase family protein [Pseudomonadota bacterium]
MPEDTAPQNPDWRTKPSDRFVLKWIKLNLSARLTPRLKEAVWLRPWMITLCASALGALAGLVYGLEWGALAGLLAAAAQVLDGVDGQLARLTGRQSPAGAFLDSVLDRYADGAMIIGMIVYLVRAPLPWPLWLIMTVGALALVGSNLISYSTARAEALSIDLGRPTLASKGTRTTVMVVCALGSAVWPLLPSAALVYLAVHPNAVIAARLWKAYHARD